jgi:hypothetical protein
MGNGSWEYEWESGVVKAASPWGLILLGYDVVGPTACFEVEDCGVTSEWYGVLVLSMGTE